MKAQMAKLSAATARLSAALARVAPTKAPLPGLTMNDEYGSCTPNSVEALRNAAKASEAWADDDAVTHWVREGGPAICCGLADDTDGRRRAWVREAGATACSRRRLRAACGPLRRNYGADRSGRADVLTIWSARP